MQKKLTLTIDQQVVEQAKRYAKQRHRSVSMGGITTVYWKVL